MDVNVLNSRMISSFEEQLDKLKKHLRVYTDTALAEKFDMKRTAIAQWRFKKRIPRKVMVKYSDILDDAYSDDSSTDLKDEIIALQKTIIELQEEIIRLKDK
jgi:hypothetical protein